jgi:hypothetical protein
MPASITDHEPTEHEKERAHLLTELHQCAQLYEASRQSGDWATLKIASEETARIARKTVGVTWDAWCSMCGFRLENKPWASGLAIEGEGRRLAHVVSVAIIGGKRFTSDTRKIVCSKCCPVILGRHDD